MTMQWIKLTMSNSHQVNRVNCEHIVEYGAAPHATIDGKPDDARSYVLFATGGQIRVLEPVEQIEALIAQAKETSEA